MLPRAALADVRSLHRRERALQAALGLADGLFAIAIAASAAILLARLLGAAIEPRPLWGLAALAAVPYALVRASRRAPSLARCAARIDRASPLRGLLIASLEADTSAWSAPLAAGLAAPRAPIPGPPLRAPIVRLAVALGLVATVVALPANAVSSSPFANPAIAEAIEAQRHDLQSLQEKSMLDPEQSESLRLALEELSEKAESGERVDWADVDAAQARLAHALDSREASLASARDALDALAARADDGASGPIGEELADALARLAESGLAADLPAELRVAAGLEASDGARAGLDASRLPAGAEAAADLARRAANALDARLADLAAAGLADPEAGRRLAELSEAERAASPTHEHGEECAGGT